MIRKGSWGVLRMAVAFFAGVLTSLFFLVPGKTGPTILVNGDQERQMADLGQAGEKIENWSDQALSYVYRTKGFIAGKLADKHENTNIP
jgi:hypothetical protein